MGSEDADTFFDISGCIIAMDAGYYITLYTTALRGGNMGPSFGQQAGGVGTVPFIEENICKSRLEMIRKLYVERIYYLNNTAGKWLASGPAPRIVAVSADGEVTDAPYTA
ncbi:hypothetical protein J7M28_04420 [bacterium]|nr:hypothetical protein [bacterium]